MIMHIHEPRAQCGRQSFERRVIYITLTSICRIISTIKQFEKKLER